MTKRSPVSTIQNIFVDAEELDSADLTAEQNYNNNFQTSLVNNQIGNGVLAEYLTQNVLFDSSLVSGLIDGLAINTQTQPSDNNFGNQLEVELTGSAVAGKKTVKVAIIGLDFQGNLQYDTLTFKVNEKQITKRHYANILTILFNDFIGQPSQSFNLGGKIVIREANPFSISRDPIMVLQDVEPNLFWRDFFVTGAVTLQTLLANALPLYNIDNLGIKTGVLQYTPITEGDVTTQVGEKFLASTNNIQKITLLLAIQNTSPGQATNLAWHGDLIVSIYPLQSTVSSPSDILPNLAIDFSPSNIPLAQLSFNYSTLQATGITLDGNAQPVDFVFSNTLVANGSTIVPGQYYVFTVKRSGSADQCDILIGTGANYNTNSRVTTFNGTNWVDIPDQELWFRVWTDSAKVSDGQAYESGHGIIIPKVQLDPTTNTQVDYSFSNVQFTGNETYTAVVSAVVQTSDEVQDARTGNPINTRQQFVPSVSLLNPIDLANLETASEPFRIGVVTDANEKSFDSSSATLSAALHSWSFVDNQVVLKIIDDITDGYRYDSSLNSLVSNLINGDLASAQFIPDVGQPTRSYRISKAELLSMVYGDVNGDGVVDDNDVAALNALVGSNLNVSPPENTQITTSGSVTTVVNGYSFYSTVFVNDFNVLFQVIDANNNILVSGNDGVLITNPNTTTLATFESQSVDFSTIFNLASCKLVVQGSSTTGNIGACTIVTLDSTSHNILDISRQHYTSDVMLQILRADIDGDFIVSTEDRYYLQQYVNKTLPFPISTQPIAKIGTSFSVIRLTVDPFVYTNFSTSTTDRTDDFQTVSGNRSTELHTTPDIFSNDGYFASHDFLHNPVTFNIVKQFTWDDSLIAVNSLARLVPSVFTASTGYIQTGTTSEGITYEVYPTVPSFDPGIINSFVPNNLIIGDGDIVNPDGSFYKVDFEIGTIVLEMPDTFNGQEHTIDMFGNFVYDYTGFGITRLGFPAMKFGDGSFVQSTALQNSQVQFSATIQSFSPNINGISSDGYDGVIVDGKIGVSIDYATGLLTLNFSNLYEDAVLQTLNTKVQVNVFLKRGGFNNQPLFVSSDILSNMLNLLGTFTMGFNIVESSGTSITSPATTTSLGTVQLAGDLGGTATSPTVVSLRGNTISSTPATLNRALLGTASGAAGWTTISGDVTPDGMTAGKLKITGLQGNTVPAPSTSGTYLEWTGTGYAWATPAGGGSSVTMGGDVTGNSSSAVVAALHGVPLSNTTPTTNQILQYSGSTWAPATLSVTLGGDVTGSSGSTTVGKILGLTVPSPSSPSTVLTYNGTGLVWTTVSGGSSFTAGGDLTGTSTSQTVAGLRGNTLPAPSGTGTYLAWTGTALAWSTPSAVTSVTMGGDVTGNSGSATVAKLQGVSVSGTTPTTNQVLTYNGTAWAAATPSVVSSVTMGGDVSGSSASATIVALHGLSLPAPSSTGTYLEYNGTSLVWATPPGGTSVTMGGDVTGNSATSTVAKLQGVSVSGTTPTTNQVLTYNGTAWAAATPSTVTSVTMGGDVTGNSASATVAKIQGLSVTSPTVASTYLEYNGTSLVWAAPPATTSVTMGGDVSGSSSAATVTKIQGNSVAAGTASLNKVLLGTSSGLTFTTISGDLTPSGSTAGAFTVSGIQGLSVSVPTTASTYLEYNGTSLVWAAAGGSFTAAGDLAGSSSSQTVVSATGASGIFNITAATVVNKIATSQGTQTVVQTVTTTSTSANATTVFTVPTGFMGRVDVTISGRQGTVGAGQQTWSGKVWNSSGTAAVVKAFAPSDSFDVIGTFAPTLSVALSGNNIVVTVTPAVATSTTFTYATAVVSTS